MFEHTRPGRTRAASRLRCYAAAGWNQWLLCVRPHVRTTACAELEQAGAIAVEGKGGRRTNGAGLSCTYVLNLSRPGHVNVPRQDANVPRESVIRAPLERHTCPGRDHKGSIEGRIEGRKKDTACGGGSSSIHLEEDIQHSKTAARDDLFVVPTPAPTPAPAPAPAQPAKPKPAPDQAKPATDKQVGEIVRQAKLKHPGLQYVPYSLIRGTVEQYPSATCEWAWKDCDEHPPEGRESVAQYNIRFDGRPSAAGGFDVYVPRTERTTPLTSSEASDWIKALVDRGEP